MIAAGTLTTNMMDSPVRRIGAKVELYESSTLVATFNHNDRLVDFSIERVAEESKFFGFGICQHLKVKIIDKERAFDNITTQNTLKVAFNVEGEITYPFPTFYVTQARRDENTNELTIYGYDYIKQFSDFTVGGLGFEGPYTIKSFIDACASYLDVTVVYNGMSDTEMCMGVNYGAPWNFDGSETLREALDDVAEATQSIYYINGNGELVFKRLNKRGSAQINLDKSKYFKLETKAGKRLGTIHNVTELGNNTYVSTTEAGSTQYIRDNAFWENANILTPLLNNAILSVGGLTITQFNCTWRGNFLLEIGDKIALTTKDDKEVVTFLLDDVIKYDGALTQESQWNYDEEGDTEGNPVTLGEQLNKTFSKVDKVAGEIDLVAKKGDELGSKISSLEINAESISSSVQQMETVLNNTVEELNGSIDVLTKKVENTISADEFEIEVSKIIGEGSNSVTTSTGFTFNEDGLNVSKSNSEMETQITEDGMRVYKNNTEVLAADNVGVKALNLHATTYLIIGENSRFEDYDGGARTGCFWIRN